MYTVIETNSSPTRETIISTASWSDAFAEAAHIATATGTEWREVYEGDDLVLRVEAGDDPGTLEAWGVLGKRAATERWAMARCQVAADARIRIAEGSGGAALWCAAIFGEVDRDAVQCVAREGVQGESAAVARWRAKQAKLEFLLESD